MAQSQESKNGYPTPGTQHYSAEHIMNNLYFMNDMQWEEACTSKDFDYVVIGSSICCVSFVDRVLKNEKNAKILVIDRGSYFHPEHFQNLPPPYALTVGGESETFHWRITEETHEGEYIKYQHGMNNFFGGRSCFWSAWCPKPTDEEMTEWPGETKKAVDKYFRNAEELLNVIPANEISKGDGNHIFGDLQTTTFDRLKNGPNIPNTTKVLHAPLAVQAEMFRNQDYFKYSASGPLLFLLVKKKLENIESKTPPSLQVVLRCLVKKIHHENKSATFLETSRGNFELGHAKLILAMGTLPPTTLMLNSFETESFPQLASIGKRFTSHFISSIIARVPLKSVTNTSLYNDLEESSKGTLKMAAIYVAGESPKSKMQFHVQLTAVIDESPVDNIYDTVRHLPDVMAAPSLEQLITSKGHVLFVCACLGQIDHNNSKNWYKLNDDADITSNATLQVVANETDNELWDVMDETTFSMLENNLTHAHEGETIEYWSNKKWQKLGKEKEGRPTPAERRVPGLVHEASTMWLGGEDDPSRPPVDLNYRFRGVNNVYLTGGALWPTGASWNPTCAMSALAIDLADKLAKNKL